MDAMPNEKTKRMPVSEALAENKERIEDIFCADRNTDLQIRSMSCAGRDACLYYMEGLADEDSICDFIIRAVKDYEVPAEDSDIISVLAESLIEIAHIAIVDEISECIRPILAGKTCMFVEGCGTALILNTLKQPHRGIDSPYSESVICGSHEGFTEHLRTNISLVRRYVQSEDLISEKMQLGTKIRRDVAILYLKGVSNEKCISEVRRRILRIRAESVLSIGALAQLIEDHPFALLPQLLQTERPDRTAAGLESGQIALLMDNSPYAIILPITMFHLLHASDDSFLRWQYGSLMRLVRLFGAVISLVLPSLYIAVTLYHTHLLPMALLTSIAETRANVPFPIVAEVLFMEFSFYLLNEAGMRMPRQIGSALGIVGALILGEAAVSASIISPILIIIIALTGLGNYAIPDYGFGMGIVIYRTMLILLSAFLGLYGVIIGLFFIAVQICSMKSFGVMYLSPVSPYRKHNPDIIMRLPTWLQKRPMFFASVRRRMGGGI